MSIDFSQDTRLGKLHTSLDKDELVLLRFSGTDYVNDLFAYRVEALSTVQNIDFDDLIGTHATVEIETTEHGPRFFDGIVTQAAWSGVGENGNRYALTLQPWLYIAGRRRQQRIFHNLSAPDIINKVLGTYARLGDPAVEGRLKSSYEPLEYTVQYRESDLNFACRLMERFGINYHFTHGLKTHTMVLTDEVESHDEIPGTSRKYIGSMGQHMSTEEHFTEWHPERNFTTGAIRLKEFDFKVPDSVLEAEHTGDAEYAEKDIESYDFPGDYLTDKAGKDMSMLRTNQERAGDRRHRAMGDCLSLGAGLIVMLDGEQVPGVKEERYVCLQADHSYVSDSYGSGGASSDGQAYSGSYVLTPTMVPLVPQRRIAPPTVQGPQTAMVVADAEGVEIDCDEFGRILVHFHWDLEKGGKSMRCRVSQNWSHQGYGGMIIPRVGMEVIVDFLEGDPDKPIVTGCVYNGKNKPYYELPENKTRSVFRTDTHQGEGFNELRIEDEKGKEEIFWHAQKDRTVKVLNDNTERVDRNEVTSVGRNRFAEVAGLENLYVGGNMKVTVSGTVTENYATGDLKTNWEGIRALGEDLDEEPKGPGDYTMDVANNITVTAGKDQSIAIAKNRTMTVGKDMSTSVGKNSVLNVSEQSTISVGTKMATDVGDEIVFKCGNASLVMKRNGDIILKGTNISIEGSGKITAKASATMTLKGATISQN